MKKNKIADIRKFITDARQTIVEYGAVLIEVNEDEEVFQIVTEKNTLTITLKGEKGHEYVYSVFMRFDTPMKGMNNSYSGKHNYHNWGNLSWVIGEFHLHFDYALKTFL